MNSSVGVLDFLKPKLVQESELRANVTGEQQFRVNHIVGIGTTSQQLATGTGRIIIKNTGTTALTLGQDREVANGNGHVLVASTGAGDGSGGEVDLFTHGPIYVISSGADGECSVLKQ